MLSDTQIVSLDYPYEIGNLKYKSIYNIENTDELTLSIVNNDTGFTKYGTIIKDTIGDNQNNKKTWNNLTKNKVGSDNIFGGSYNGGKSFLERVLSVLKNFFGMIFSFEGTEQTSNMNIINILKGGKVMKIKFKYIFIIIFIAILIVLGIIIKNSFTKEEKNIANEAYTDDNGNMYENIEGTLAIDNRLSNEWFSFHYGIDNPTDDDKKTFQHYIDNDYEFILMMMKPGNDWRLFPLSKSYREECRGLEKKGLLSEYNFDRIEYSQKTLDYINENNAAGIPEIIGTKGKEKYLLTIIYSINMGYKDFEVKSCIQIQDKDGKPIETRLKCTRENYESILQHLIDDYDEYNKYILVTDKFSENTPIFVKIFQDQFDPKTTWGSRLDSYENPNYDDLTADFWWRVDGRFKGFKVKFTLNNDLYLDDAEIIDMWDDEQ